MSEQVFQRANHHCGLFAHGRLAGLRQLDVTTLREALP